MYYLTGEEYQIKNAYPDYFPVNEKAQQRIWDIVSATKETTLSDGTQVNPYRCEVAYNDYEVVVEALDQDPKNFDQWCELFLADLQQAKDGNA